MIRKSLVILVMGTMVLFVASLSSADVPRMISYQGKLTTASGGCLNDTVQMTFSIYPDTLGSLADWSETQTQVVVQEGIFNVLLGAVDTIPQAVFDGSVKYLGVQVESDPEMTPLKPIVSVAYAYRAGTADGGGVNCEDCDDRFVNVQGPDSIIGSSYPEAMLTVHNDGNAPGILVRAVGGVYGIGIRIDTTYHHGIEINDAGEHGIRINSPEGWGIAVSDAGDNGVGIISPAENGIYIATPAEHGIDIRFPGHNGIDITSPEVHGVHIDRPGQHGIKIDSAGLDGINIYNAGDCGVRVSHAGETGVYAYGRKLGGIFQNDTTGSGYPTLEVKNYYGATSGERLANFWASSTLRFYFRGDGHAYADGGWNTFKKNPKGGYESFSSVQAERQELISHGKGTLAGGVAQVNYSSSFSEFVTDAEEIEITLTAVGSYSGLYIAERSRQGFTVKSGAGDPDCQFTWLAIGVEKGGEERLTVGNIDEEERMAMEKENEMRREREERRMPRQQAR